MTRVVLPAIRKDGGYIHGEEHVVSGAMFEDEPKLAPVEVFGRLWHRAVAVSPETQGA